MDSGRGLRPPRNDERKHARHQARPRARRSLQAAHLRHLQDRRASPDLLAGRHRVARNWFAEQCTAAGLETTIDGIGNILGKSKASGAQGALRLASGKPEPCGLARRRARLRLCAGSRARDSEKRAATPVSTSWCSATRRGISARSSARSRSPALLTDERHRQGASNKNDGTPMREALRSRRLCGPAAPRDRAGALHGVLRGAYRAGRHARDRRSCASASSPRSSRSGSTASR